MLLLFSLGHCSQVAFIQGESGGPLMVNRRGIWYELGVHSGLGGPYFQSTCVGRLIYLCKWFATVSQGELKMCRCTVTVRTIYATVPFVVVINIPKCSGCTILVIKNLTPKFSGNGWGRIPNSVANGERVMGSLSPRRIRTLYWADPYLGHGDLRTQPQLVKAIGKFSAHQTRNRPRNSSLPPRANTLDCWLSIE